MIDQRPLMSLSDAELLAMLPLDWRSPVSVPMTAAEIHWTLQPADTDNATAGTMMPVADIADNVRPAHHLADVLVETIHTCRALRENEAARIEHIVTLEAEIAGYRHLTARALDLLHLADADPDRFARFMRHQRAWERMIARRFIDEINAPSMQRGARG